MLLNTLKNEKLKKNPLEAKFYWVFLGFIGQVFGWVFLMPTLTKTH